MTSYKICPICKERIEKIFEKERKKEELSYKEFELLKKIKDGYNYGYDDISEIRDGDDIFDLEDKIDEDIIPANDNFQSVRVDWEWSLKKDCLWISFTAECSTCGTKWILEDEFPIENKER